MSVLDNLAPLLQACLDYEQDADVENLHKIIELQKTRYEALTSALDCPVLLNLPGTYVPEAKIHLLTTQQDIDESKDSSEPWALDEMGHAKDNAGTALNALTFALQTAREECSKARITEDQDYTNALLAAFANAVDAGILKSAALVTLDRHGWPDCSPEVTRTFSSLLGLADLVRFGIRALSDHHFRFRTSRYMDGNLPINCYGYQGDRGVVWVSEAMAGRDNSKAIKEARDEMEQASTDRYSSLPEIQEIQNIVNYMLQILQAAASAAQRATLERRTSAYRELRQKASAA